MGFVPIQELEDAVEDNKNEAKLFSELLKETELEHLKQLEVCRINLDDYSRKVQNDINHLELQVTDLQLQLKEKDNRIIDVERKNVSLKLHLDLVNDLLKEERETLRETQEMIYLRTGMKREDVFVVEGETDKELKSVHSSLRTRSSIKKQLEIRAENLLKNQQAKEAEQITKGDLAPTERAH